MDFKKQLPVKMVQKWIFSIGIAMLCSYLALLYVELSVESNPIPDELNLSIVNVKTQLIESSPDSIFLFEVKPHFFNKLFQFFSKDFGDLQFNQILSRYQNSYDIYVFSDSTSTTYAQELEGWIHEVLRERNTNFIFSVQSLPTSRFEWLSLSTFPYGFFMCLFSCLLILLVGITRLIQFLNDRITAAVQRFKVLARISLSFVILGAQKFIRPLIGVILKVPRVIFQRKNPFSQENLTFSENTSSDDQVSELNKRIVGIDHLWSLTAKDNAALRTKLTKQVDANRELEEKIQGLNRQIERLKLMMKKKKNDGEKNEKILSQPHSAPTDPQELSSLPQLNIE